ncbi:hypothetical protein ACFL6U_25325 [Planctomycetota bacterium]
MSYIENQLNAFLEAHKAKTATSQSLDEHILQKAFKAQNEMRREHPNSDTSLWRRTMKSKRTWISAAAAILFISLALTFFYQTTPTAYAIADTLKAMESIHTVSFKAFLYKQQMEIECQMRLSDTATKPTHIRLSIGGHPYVYSKIDNEHGSFAYNAETNRFRRITRDERTFNWYPDFRQLFKQALTDSEFNQDIRIDRDTDPNMQREMIVIDIPQTHRDVRYWIDPETKLPIRVTTLTEHNLHQLRRQTIAAREIWNIRYNEELPEDTFSVPPDAEEVFEEIDTIVRPGMGLPVGDMTEAEACIKLIETVQVAFNALDFTTASKLFFPMGIPPQEVLDQIKAMKAQAKTPLVEMLSHDEPYEEGPYWYVPCRVRDIKKGEKEDLVRIRFFELDGVRACIIAEPD